MTYIATYRDGKAILKDELPSSEAFDLETAYKEAKKIAKKNGWTLVKVEPKVYPPVPQIVYPPSRDRDPWPDHIKAEPKADRGCAYG
jgi:hypothetical protein